MGQGPDVSLLDARRDEQGPGDGARAGAPEAAGTAAGEAGPEGRKERHDRWIFRAALVLAALPFVVTAVALLVGRRGGTPLVLATLVAFLLVVRTLGPEFPGDDWNLTITVLPYALLAFLTWSMLAGEMWALPAAAFVASFLVQTHIGFTSTAVPLLARVELLSRWTTVPADEYEELRAERERLMADHGAGLSDLTDEELATQLGEIVDAMNGDDPTVTAYDVAVFLDERPAG